MCFLALYLYVNNISIKVQRLKALKKLLLKNIMKRRIGILDLLFLAIIHPMRCSGWQDQI